MKKILNPMLCFGLCCAMLILVACGGPITTVTLGTYNGTNSTFTANTANADYTIERNGYNLVLKGDIPYSAGTLGIPAGNIIAIKFKTDTKITPDDGTRIKTTNSLVASGWNTYGKEALETDGSLIWVTKVSKENNVEIKIKWSSNTEEVTYTLSVDDDAILATA